MTCSELSRLQAIAARASDQLTRREPCPAAIEFPPAQWEREAHRAAFNADLDVLFHKAGCAECKRAADSKLEEQRQRELQPQSDPAPIPGDYRKVA